MADIIYPTWVFRKPKLTKGDYMKLFAQFLKHNGVYKQFRVNCHKYGKRGANFFYVFNSLRDLYIAEDRKDFQYASLFIAGSFNFSYTEEGNRFWCMIDDAWNSTIKYT